MRNRIITALQDTYEAISFDLGKVDLNGAVECTIDADRPAMFCGDIEAVIEFNKLSYDKKLEVAKEALSVYF